MSEPYATALSAPVGVYTPVYSHFNPSASCLSLHQKTPNETNTQSTSRSQALQLHRDRCSSSRPSMEPRSPGCLPCHASAGQWRQEIADLRQFVTEVEPPSCADHEAVGHTTTICPSPAVRFARAKTPEPIVRKNKSINLLSRRARTPEPGLSRVAGEPTVHRPSILKRSSAEPTITKRSSSKNLFHSSSQVMLRSSAPNMFRSPSYSMLRLFTSSKPGHKRNETDDSELEFDFPPCRGDVAAAVTTAREAENEIVGVEEERRRVWEEVLTPPMLMNRHDEKRARRKDFKKGKALDDVEESLIKPARPRQVHFDAFIQEAGPREEQAENSFTEPCVPNRGEDANNAQLSPILPEIETAALKPFFVPSPFEEQVLPELCIQPAESEQADSTVHASLESMPTPDLLEIAIEEVELAAREAELEEALEKFRLETAVLQRPVRPPTPGPPPGMARAPGGLVISRTCPTPPPICALPPVPECAKKVKQLRREDDVKETIDNAGKLAEMHREVKGKIRASIAGSSNGVVMDQLGGDLVEEKAFVLPPARNPLRLAKLSHGRQCTNPIDPSLSWYPPPPTEENEINHTLPEQVAADIYNESEARLRHMSDFSVRTKSSEYSTQTECTEISEHPPKQAKESESSDISVQARLAAFEKRTRLLEAALLGFLKNCSAGSASLASEPNPSTILEVYKANGQLQDLANYLLTDEEGLYEEYASV